MTTLHLVFNANGGEACSQRKSDNDTVVLLGDGVYAQIPDAL